MRQPAASWSDLIPAGVIGAACLTVLTAGMLAPPRAGPILALFPPWVGPARAFAAATAPGWRAIALRRTWFGLAVALRRRPGRATAAFPRGALILADAGFAGCTSEAPGDGP